MTAVNRQFLSQFRWGVVVQRSKMVVFPYRQERDFWATRPELQHLPSMLVDVEILDVTKVKATTKDGTVWLFLGELEFGKWEQPTTAVDGQHKHGYPRQADFAKMDIEFWRIED